MKPGNRAEEKTLMTRMMGIASSLDSSIASLRDGKPWTESDGDSTEEPI